MNSEKFEMIAKTFQGLEDVLAQEIVALGGEEVEQGIRMVSFIGDKSLLYKANLRLRTALRILKPILTFNASNTDEVYNAIKEFNWEELINEKSTFSIDSVVFSDDFRHSKFVTYRAKDAIVDYFIDKTGKRPNVRLTNADLSLNLHIAGHVCTLSLDSSGESLHRRGYRVDQNEAPLNEVLAAGMILKSGWNGTKSFIDPMCGSGTLLIEAALIATNTPPGVYRSGYAFEKWADYDANLFDSIYNDESEEKDFEFKIYGSDISRKAIEIAMENVKSAGMSKYVYLSTRPFQDYTVDTVPQNTTLVMNPPYGERISSFDILRFYEEIGTTLKHQFKGFDAWILSYKEECFEKIGLKPSLKIKLMNGGLDCEFRKYEIFDGSMKTFKTEGGSLSKNELDLELPETEYYQKDKIRKERSLKDRRSNTSRRNETRDRKPSSGERRESSFDRENSFKKDRPFRERSSEERSFDGERRERKFDSNRKDRNFGGERRERKFDSDHKDRGFEGERRERRFNSDRNDRSFGGERRERKFDSDRNDRGFGGERRERRFDSDREGRDGFDTRKKYEKSGNFMRNSEGKLELRSDGVFKPRGERTFDPNRQYNHNGHTWSPDSDNNNEND